MCADGWAGVGWPKEYGGQGRDPIDQFIFFDESMRAGAPVRDAHAQHRRPDDHELRHRLAEGVLPPEDPRRRHPLLHRLLRAAGRHRPRRPADPGRPRRRRVRHQRPEDVDLPRRRCRLLLAGRAHRSRGQEAQGHLGDHRPDGHARHHHPAPHTSWATHDINATFFDDVRVPAKYLVGEENGGWGLITNQLNHERVTLCSSGSPSATSPTSASGPRTPSLPDGRRVIDQEWVQLNLARVHARLEFLKLANWKVAWSAEQGQPAPGRRLDGEGLRHRVLPRGLPAPHGGPRARAST